MRNSANIFFSDNVKFTSEIFVAEIDFADSKQELLKQYNDKFHFPYFGYNWDALWDCLCDLDWISQNEIVIIHSCVPNLSSKDLSIYLEILCDMAEGWKKDDGFGPKEIRIYFKNKDRDIINHFLKE